MEEAKILAEYMNIMGALTRVYAKGNHELGEEGKRLLREASRPGLELELE